MLSTRQHPQYVILTQLTLMDNLVFMGLLVRHVCEDELLSLPFQLWMLSRGGATPLFPEQPSRKTFICRR